MPEHLQGTHLENTALALPALMAEASIENRVDVHLGVYQLDVQYLASLDG